MSRYKPVGWRNDSHRHYLAAKGVKSKYALPPGFEAGKGLDGFKMTKKAMNVVPNPEPIMAEELDKDIDMLDGSTERNGAYYFARKPRDVIPGGVGKDVPYSGVSAYALMIGTKVEMEHTSDKRIAREIAKDHLVEDPEYYEKLKRAGL